MHPLERVLRFRRLDEQQARRELERGTQLLRAATAARDRQSVRVAEQRANLARSWAKGKIGSGQDATKAEAARDERNGNSRESNPNAPAGDTLGWLIEEAALEFSGWDRAQLEQVCMSEARRLEPLVKRYMECRRALRQAEKLVEQRAELARVEQERRSQAGADEWFLQQNVRRSQHE